MALSKDIHLESCCPLSRERKVRLTISDSVHLLNQSHWNQVLEDKDILLSIGYLGGLESEMESTMEFRYVIYYGDDYKPVGIAYFQVADLVDTGSKYAQAVKNLGKGIGSSIVSELKVRTLICGNVFHCGEHGFRFVPGTDRTNQLDLVERTLDRIKKDGDLEGKVSIVLFKEFWPESFPITEKLIDKRYHMFRMDMNMLLDIRPEWDSIETYLQDLTSKSRTRIHAIQKKSMDLEFKDMTVAEIEAAEEQLEALFKQVLAHSPFTFGILNMRTYARWKETLGDRLIFQGVFYRGAMVGFQSAFVNGEELEVQYVGIDYRYNEELRMYQRMLVELLDIGIKRGLSRIGYGRTAEQAKSSLGAVAVEMRLYTKHRNMIANKLITPVMNSVVPTEFEHRSPFKQ